MKDMSKEMFLIWSIEHSSWWKPDEFGYTPSWDMAGRYTRERAFEISARANLFALNEVPVPVGFFDYQTALQSNCKRFADRFFAEEQKKAAHDT